MCLIQDRIWRLQHECQDGKKQIGKNIVYVSKTQIIILEATAVQYSCISLFMILFIPSEDCNLRFENNPKDRFAEIPNFPNNDTGVSRWYLPSVVHGQVAGHGQRDSSARPNHVLQEMSLGPSGAGVGRVLAALVDGGCQLVGEGEGVVRHTRRLGQGGQH